MTDRFDHVFQLMFEILGNPAEAIMLFLDFPGRGIDAARGLLKAADHSLFCNKPEMLVAADIVETGL
ncbi:hypothetical protein [uncultured Roseibium sp.]|uniref:hypothetical protein n=1 Tax=uncultured Roseibium sp. TaxID=1936171 RepID=UPI0032180601